MPVVFVMLDSTDGDRVNERSKSSGALSGGKDVWRSWLGPVDGLRRFAFGGAAGAPKARFLGSARVGTVGEPMFGGEDAMV